MAIDFTSGTTAIDTDSSLDPPNTGTATFWYYPKDVTANQRPFGFHDAFEVRQNLTSLYNELWAGGGGSIAVTVAINTLCHIAFTWSRPVTDVTLQNYKDGAFVNTQTRAGTDPGSAVLQIGRSRNLDPINALMYDLRFYDRVLTAAEIATIYAARGMDGIVYGLIHRWLMRGVEGATVGAVKDLAGNIDCSLLTGTPVYAGDKLKTRRSA